MSAILVPAATDYIRAAFTTKQVAVVQSYGGQFSGAEIGKVGYACPAIFVTGLGWRQADNGKRLTGRGTRRVRMAAFVVTAHVKREERMKEAAALADRLCTVLCNWHPANPTEQLYTLAALEEDPVAENLYSRKIDDSGQALWLVDWFQTIKPAPGLSAGQLYDLLQIDLTHLTRQGVAPPVPLPSGAVPTVTDDVQFPPIPNT